MKLFIGVCNTQDSVPSGFFWSFLGQKPIPYPILVERAGHPWDVVRNNQLIKQFLDSDCDVMAKMDIDQQYPVDYLATMVGLVEEYKVVGPLIYDRMEGSGFMPLAFKWHDYPKLSKYDITGQSGLASIPYTHTNLFYCREVLEKIPPPWYEAHLNPEGTDRANHVDFTFLDKIKKAGYVIWTNLDVTVKHLAQIGVDGDIHAKWNFNAPHSEVLQPKG